MTDSQRTWRYGIVGCGAFGRFCLEALEPMKRVRPVAAADVYAPAVKAVARDFGLRVSPGAEHLISDPEVDLVHIITPPSTHYELALAALRAGKHVLCEKPLAVTQREADELVSAARRRGLALGVNHLLRYSEILALAKRIIDSGVLGRPLHAVFENCASDEKLPADHWFWNPDVSGGIFVEHGAHFFDLYAWWFGAGRVLSAGSMLRDRTGQEDRVFCTVLYDNGAVVQFYHGFDQPGRLDRAVNRVLLEHGDIEVIGWIPMQLRVHGIVDEGGQEQLARLCPEWKTQVIESYGPDRRSCRGRGNSYSVVMRGRWELSLPPEQRQEIYAQLFRCLLDDHIRKMENPSYQPHLTAVDARNAVAIAEQARSLAGQQCRAPGTKEA